VRLLKTGSLTMKSLLIIKSSVAGDQSKSGQLANDYQAIWLENNPGGTVTVRDVGTQSLVPLDAATVGAYFTPAEQRSEAQQPLLTQSDTLIAEIQAHDDIVITAPMYNFSIPSQLKVYFDSIARVGVTFKYTETGPVGLLTGKRALVITSRGGMYTESNDNQVPFIRQFLGFIGINEIEVVYVQGLGMGEKAVESALTQAKEKLVAWV
jgi:FMN-dependent NADH-azoreductase